ncbi:helix-turn-helix domain-containing protein [Delftia acidovorans]|uniref:helix-turn-helix domain-containing protein n=1 Tax=Delftia acidovorans TaxID=80866 RepID=UPI000BCB2398|nr:helix-turn-helix domain-containing protein [Delftia acidovorans]SOE37584.1 Helix-turn-helix [Delftia acidovorans]
MSNANTFGARLVLARNEKGLSQFTLAERSSMAQTQLSRYETDKVRPRLRIINSLAAALSVDPDWLLNGDDDADVEPVDTSPTTQCKLRIPVDLYAGLSKLAGAANRSLNAEIVHRLAQTLGEDFAAEQPAAQPVLAEMLAQTRLQTDYMRELLELARDAANPD